MDSHMCIIHQALTQRKDCFIASEEWAIALDTPDGSTHLQTLFCRLRRQMAIWPNLVWGKLDLRESTSSIDRFVLRQRANQVKTAMYKICMELDAMIRQHKLAKSIPPTCLFNLVSEMLEFKDPTAALLLCYHAIYNIIVYQILKSLADDPNYNLEVESEILYLSQRVWMLVDHGRQYKPLVSQSCKLC